MDFPILAGRCHLASGAVFEWGVTAVEASTIVVFMGVGFVTVAVTDRKVNGH